jgi:GalNAc-alpha-(1->4)-GalNAc-alpha-(1->3)-diNAcBac-PP-undecaprenol alpha-1,4-N-acetyl-D-galactosaminyltransferase
MAHLRTREDRPFRLTAVIGSLVAGGAERMMATLTEAWAAAGWDVELILTLAAPSEIPFFAIDPRVKVRQLDLYRPSQRRRDRLLGNLRRLQVMRRAIRASQPDVVLAFMIEINVLTILATRGMGVPVIVEEHIYASWPPLSRRWRIARLLTYPLASSVVALTPAALATLGLARGRRGRVIPNPVLAPPPSSVARADPPIIVAMGRLVPQKGFDMLLDAFAPVVARHPGWSLEIWGEGPDRALLEGRRDALGLGGSVRFPGVTPRADEVLRRASIFVLSSRREGFPMVLGEAMANGVPSVSFDCPSGPRELITDGVDGLLVPANDVDALSSALERLVVDRNLARRLGERATGVVERYSLAAILEQWSAIFAEVGAIPGVG